MPKAAIYKDGKTQFLENEVGFPKDALISPPSGDALRTEEFDQRELGVFVPASADLGHHI